MPISASSSRDGSSSTTMAMFFIASRNRCGIDASASATWLSNFSRRIVLVPRPLPPGADDRRVVFTLVAHDADIAERLRLADPAAGEDQRGGRLRRAVGGPRGAELFLDVDRVVAFGDPDAIADAQHMAVDGQPRDAERVAEDDVGGLAADAGQLRERVHVGGHLAAVVV